MARDPQVFVMGEDVGAGGVFNVTPGLLDEFGPSRVMDTPISELGFTGAAFGAAMRGMRPVIEIMFGDFLALSMDALINQAGRLPFVTNGQIAAPLVVRVAVGGGVSYGPLHSEVPTNWVFNEPGLKVVAPATAADAKALMKAAIQDEGPVVYFEHKLLYSTTGEVTDEGADPRIGEAAVRSEGQDVTLVAAMAMVDPALQAASLLAERGVSAEVIDLRTLRPLDRQTVVASVTKTGRLVTVEEGRPVGGYGAELLATAVEAVPNVLGARVTLPDVPVPFNAQLEAAIWPTAERIEAAASSLLQRVA
jgi:pyruvate/2-oxoglutarate/acetoin dehydrogenase E1 component